MKLPRPPSHRRWMASAVVLLLLVAGVSAQDPEGLAKDALVLISDGVADHKPELVSEGLSDLDMVYATVSDKTRKKIHKAVGNMFAKLVPREPVFQRPGDLVDGEEGTRLEVEACYTLAIGILHDKDGGPDVLLKALKNKHIKSWHEVRALVYEGLGLRADPALIKEFVKVLEDAEPAVAFEAAAALGQFHDRGMDLRRQAATALVKAFAEHDKDAAKEAKKGRSEEKADYLAAVEVAFNESLTALTRASPSSAPEWSEWLKEHGKDEEW